MTAKEQADKHNGQVEVLSVVLAQVKSFEGMKRTKIREYQYNIDILEKQIKEDYEIIKFLEKLITGKKNPTLVDQLSQLEEQINKIAEKQ